MHTIQTPSRAEEAKRFTALGVPTAVHYPTGRIVKRAPVWHPSRILLMLRSSTYIGEHVFESTYGEVSRQVPPLVPQALWETAQAQIEKNRHTAKSNATRAYLLRGLIVCGCCGYYDVGQVLNPTRTRTHMYYRYGARTSYKTGIRQRCIGKGVRADWLEAEGWKGCHAAQEAQATLTEALATQLTATTTMLERLQPQLAAIEAAHDLTAIL